MLRAERTWTTAHQVLASAVAAARTRMRALGSQVCPQQHSVSQGETKKNVWPRAREVGWGWAAWWGPMREEEEEADMLNP